MAEQSLLTDVLEGEHDPSVYLGRAVELRRLIPVAELALGRAVRAGTDNEQETLQLGCEALETVADLLDRIAAELDA